MTITVLIRADASRVLGSGHVMRCLTLAHALACRGATVAFMCREHLGHMAEKVIGAGFKCQLTGLTNDTTLGTTWENDAKEMARLASDYAADWVIIDHYDLDARWEEQVAATGCKIMVIDDQTDRPHHCDVLVNQNLGAKAEDYANLVPDTATVLAGSKFAMLRPEFARLRTQSLARRALPSTDPRTLLISMGGADLPNATGWVLDMLADCDIATQWTVTIVMGGQAPHLDQIRAKAKDMPFVADVIVDTPDMANLMADADLAIGAAGSTSWERCCLGLPTLMVVLADNQKESAAELQKADAAIVIKLADTQKAIQQIQKLKNNFEYLQRLSYNSSNIIDGLGSVRVVENIWNTIL